MVARTSTAMSDKERCRSRRVIIGVIDRREALAHATKTKRSSSRHRRIASFRNHLVWLAGNFLVGFGLHVEVFLFEGPP